MRLAEHLYRMLLRLYPTAHRREYGRAMLIHARDLERDAQQNGAWDIVCLCASFLKDGLVNACREHWEGSIMANSRFKPAPWLSVLLAALPGLLILLTRRFPLQQLSLDLIFWYVYLGLLVVAVPIIWGLKKRFPVWALLPAGALVWSLVYSAGRGLSAWANQDQSGGVQGGVAALNFLVICVICAAVLRRNRFPRSAWILVGILVVGNFALALLSSLDLFGENNLLSGLVQYFSISGLGPLEGLMLVALGMLFAREHGVLAILVVVGGYSYMFADSDYLFGYPQRDWTWLSTYFAAITILFLVVVPIALLRARTRLGRILAVFLPLLAFHILRLGVPLLVIQGPIQMRPGNVIATINILLSFVLAWVVYDAIAGTKQDFQASSDLAADPVAN
jgi:hypothetical protein